MTASTLTTKGQITLPKEMRDQLGLEAGDRVDFVRSPDGVYTVVPVKSTLGHLKGCLPPRRKPVSLDDMDRAVRRRAGGRGR